MLNAIGKPMQCDLAFHPDYPKFRPVKWTEIADFNKWIPQLSERYRLKMQASSEFRMQDERYKWVSIPSFSEWLPIKLKSHKRFSETEKMLPAEADVDLDFDGVNEKIIRYPGDCSGYYSYKRSRKDYGPYDSRGVRMGLTMVLGKNKEYDPIYNEFEGHVPFYYDGRIRLARWGGGQSFSLKLMDGIVYRKGKDHRPTSAYCKISHRVTLQGKRG